jgi:hypothetical protein
VKNKNIIYVLFVLTFTTICLNSKSQLKAKVFYFNIPEVYKIQLRQASMIKKIETPSEFYKRKKESKVEEKKIAIPLNVDTDLLEEASIKKDKELLAFSLTLEINSY